MFRNLATLTVNGQAGDDSIEVRAFALVNPESYFQKETKIAGGEGVDSIRYAVNAPVSIDGGDGLDSVSVIGTEFADDFVITRDGVYGAGLNVNFVNVEVLRVDGAEGDDNFYIQSTNEAILTQVVGGLGSDTFQIADGVERTVTSNDLLGHSGLILHDLEVEGEDPAFAGPTGDGIRVNGVSANVRDADEPGILISELGGFLRVAEGEVGVLPWYEVVLTRRPDQAVRVTALAPNLSAEEEARGEEMLRLRSEGTGLGDSVVLVFTSENWATPQKIFVSAVDDDALEPQKTGVIQHKVESDEVVRGTVTSVSVVTAGADVTTVLEIQGGVESAAELVGRRIELVDLPEEIDAGPEGRSLIISAVEEVGAITRLTLQGTFKDSDGADLANEDITGASYRIGRYSGRLASLTPPALDADGEVTRDSDGDLVSIVDLKDGFATEYDLTGRLFEIIGVPDGESAGGLGQSLIVKSAERDAATGVVTRLTLFGAFDPEDAPLEDSVYRIRFYDGLQIPTVAVQIDDNDQADVILVDSEDLRVFERTDGAIDGIDTIAAYQVKLSRAPRDGAVVEVDLDVTSADLGLDQVLLSEEAGTQGAGVLTLRFDGSDWQQGKTVYVQAVRNADGTGDGVAEGFHRGLIEHSVRETTSDIDLYVLVTDAFEDTNPNTPDPTLVTDTLLLENAPIQFRGGVDGEAAANTITGLSDLEFTVADLGAALEAEGISDLSFLTVRVVKGAGQGQIRRVETIDGNTVTVDADWETRPDETSRFSITGIEVRIYTETPEGLELETLSPDRYELNGSTIVFFDAEQIVEEREFLRAEVDYAFVEPGYAGRTEERISVEVVDGDTAGVLILESNGSTDVVEAAVADPDDAEAGVEGRVFDTYQVVLSRPPSEGTTVEVIVEPAPTRTSRGDLIRSDNVQVEVRAGANAVAKAGEERLVLLFDSTNWNVAQTVEVVAIVDDLVDGGDTKAFAPRLRTLTDLQGPLLIDGFGGSGSLEGLTPPVLLPRSPDTPPDEPTGDRIDVTASTITVDRRELEAFLGGGQTSTICWDAPSVPSARASRISDE